MSRLIADTGPLVALFNARDRNHQRARAELAALRPPALVCLPVLTELLYLSPTTEVRVRIAESFQQGVLLLAGPDDAPTAARRALGWMERYAEHRPDFADAFLVSWLESDASLKLWTFDGEFRSVWRTAKGRRVHLVGRE